MQHTIPTRTLYCTCALLILLSLLPACATRTVGHLPKHVVNTLSSQTFQMQYITLHVKSYKSSGDINLKIDTQIITEGLPPWATQLDIGNLTIYLVSADNTIITTQNFILPTLNLSQNTKTTLNINVALPDPLSYKTPLYIAFGYHLPVSNTSQTRRIILTEAAAEQ